MFILIPLCGVAAVYVAINPLNHQPTLKMPDCMHKIDPDKPDDDYFNIRAKNSQQKLNEYHKKFPKADATSWEAEKKRCNYKYQ